jgi:hypothetical protein
VEPEYSDQRSAAQQYFLGLRELNGLTLNGLN